MISKFILVPLGYYQYQVWVFKILVDSTTSKKGYGLHAKENNYSWDVEPLLDFIITIGDEVLLGAHATLLDFNNNKGFQKHNHDSICNMGQSTKMNSREGGYIGEKGIKYECFRFSILEII